MAFGSKIKVELARQIRSDKKLVGPWRGLRGKNNGINNNGPAGVTDTVLNMSVRPSEPLQVSHSLNGYRARNVVVCALPSIRIETAIIRTNNSIHIPLIF